MSKIEFYKVPTKFLKLMTAKERLLIKMYNGWNMMKDENGYYFRSISKLMEDCDTKNRNTVVKALKEFEEEGLIEMKKEKGNTTYFKFLDDETGIISDTTTSIKVDTTTGIKVDTIYKNNIKKNKNKTFNTIEPSTIGDSEDEVNVKEKDFNFEMYKDFKGRAHHWIKTLINTGMNPNEERSRLFHEILSQKREGAEKYRTYYREYIKAYNDAYSEYNLNNHKNSKYTISQGNGDGDMVREGGLYE